MKVSSLNDLFIDQLKDIYSAEKQLLKALPKMVKAASSQSLRDAISMHIEETIQQVARLESIAETVGKKLTGKKCKAMEGLLEEGKEVLEMEGPDALIDLAIVAASQRVEHYEISAYSSARSCAEHLGLTEVAELLQETLDEETAADEKLSEVASDELYEAANDDEPAEDEEELSPRRKTANR